RPARTGRLLPRRLAVDRGEGPARGPLAARRGPGAGVPRGRVPGPDAGRRESPPTGRADTPGTGPEGTPFPGPVYETDLAVAPGARAAARASLRPPRPGGPPRARPASVPPGQRGLPG